MPFVDNDVKLDFKDVLFRPKRSSLRSRSEVLLLKQSQNLFLLVLTVEVSKITNEQNNSISNNYILVSGRFRTSIYLSKFQGFLYWCSCYGC